MKSKIICLLLLVACKMSFAGSARDSLLNKLDLIIKNAHTYDEEKLKRINTLRTALNAARNSSLQYQFDVCQQLYEEFKVFKYDSAFAYARKLQELAAEMNDSQRINYAGVKLGFVLLSSGMFREAGDYLLTVDVNLLPDSSRAEYYSLKGRYYYDMSDYSSDAYFAPGYTRQGNIYIDSALMLYEPHSFNYDYSYGLMYQKKQMLDSSRYYYSLAVAHQDITMHQQAIAVSSLGNIFIKMGMMDSAIVMMAKAAMADILSCTKETTAMFILAELLFKERNVKHASRYIEYAVADAAFYGARLRKVQVSAILPIIEVEKINTVEAQKKLLFVYSAIATLLLLALIWLAVIIYRQYRKLQAAQQVITSAHALQQEINYKLLEANKIKEEYIGYCFQINSSYLDKIKKFKKLADQKLTDSKYAEVRYLINNIDLKEERDELFRNFDRIFLKIFPNFVTVFNSFFKEEDQIRLKDNELLNTDLRIFALIRIGISDNVKIAQILEYSVNTIYTYKTKIKNKAIIPKEEFEERLMDIRAL